MTPLLPFATFLLGMYHPLYRPHRPLMPLPIGFGGSYEEYWPRARPPHPYMYDPRCREYLYPHVHTQQYRPVRYERNATLSQKVARVRRELSISSDASITKVIAQANEMMGFEDTGTLSCQLDRIVRHLGV